MSQSDDKISDAERRLPLTPLDEALLARVQSLAEIAEAVLRNVGRPYPATDRGAVLRDALYVARLAEQLVDRAVVVERERDASWTDIGRAAGTSRQAAHERWADHVHGWALAGRRRTGPRTGPADYAATNLDTWFAGINTDQPQAISAALASLADPEARRAAQDQRVKADRIRRKIQALKNANTAARKACYEALGTEAADEKRAAWAGNHLTQARAYDRLADAEAPLGTEHKRAAATQRSLAHDILDNKTTPAPTTDTQEHPA
ncbi:hypothetical protein [Streptomyces aureoverticillatus]|uniref:hypothetical protein n=1 Tax=Streptomyces aureoverticillatus TaxID=66871 RepID=UPI0013D9D7EB|nr:hypothetical protein [Streptomyces aureoverticillatus]QIB47821.1 hypothetical protein G3H79_36865 [Streptomyces aureoverticillatus]